MKKILIACFIAPVVHAQIIECPKFYPWQDTPLAEVPYQHKGKGIVAKASLSGAGMVTGQINSRGELQGDSQQVKDGWNIEYGFGAEPKWLVCHYGKSGDIAWWEQIDDKAKHCALKIRESKGDPMDVKLICL